MDYVRFHFPDERSEPPHGLEPGQPRHAKTLDSLRNPSKLQRRWTVAVADDPRIGARVTHCVCQSSQATLGPTERGGTDDVQDADPFLHDSGEALALGSGFTFQRYVSSERVPCPPVA